MITRTPPINQMTATHRQPNASTTAAATIGKATETPGPNIAQVANAVARAPLPRMLDPSTLTTMTRTAAFPTYAASSPAITMAVLGATQVIR